ncbi:hypothetical protein P153DRAFT_371145 [Dothidotthia symphoricarpi CBS 119687]|uniref:Uncharacterized protein n=1 Tax=Dothidotthia symphoricarpi CBS 119687 TaxID=1392245 RepID=A0A6A6A0Q8_9PLEO|nr:uncharacterized protein P153DRAFT_371145 [Dothidotthia symphoricarpi CBS 119687]KAF2124288.1 hypothetical protein P153DRAFT_371145 [Dothidotthia symphoricarpi CBS 119687]
MSDYGDDYSDYGDEWFYIEEEEIVADDLAEHAVASPPPTTYGDDDNQPDWDRFDYYNDIEYASDGFDDAKFEAYDVKDAQTGQKRKRVVRNSRSKKKQRPTQQAGGPAELVPGYSPVVWRSQTGSRLEPKLLDDNAQSYALLKDWRKKLPDTPRWTRGSPHPPTPTTQSSTKAERKVAFAPEPMSPTSDLEDEGGLEEEGLEEDEEDEEAMDIDQEALMAALQSRLAVAGGPLSGMDPQQLLQFAMRMAAGKDDGDDIAGDMADAMLDQGEEDDDKEDADAEANLLSWVAQQRNAQPEALAATPIPDAVHDNTRPPTPPLSEANRSICAPTDVPKPAQPKTKSTEAKTGIPNTRQSSTLKRKADDSLDAESSTKATKKRATRSFDAPTASSQARTLPAKPTRSTRAKRG